VLYVVKRKTSRIGIEETSALHPTYGREQSGRSGEKQEADKVRICRGRGRAKMEVIIGWLSANRRRVFSWFEDDVFRRMFVNAGKLLSANAVACLLGFATTALTARALGPENYGILALVLVYQLTIGKLATFNAWQAIIKYGSEALHANDPGALRQLIKLGFTLDVSSAVLGTAVAMILAGPLIGLLGWDQSVRPLLILYSVLILFSLSGTPIGILRLFDRFDLLSYAAVLCAFLRLIAVVWCLISSQALFGFVLAYLITGILGQLYNVFASLWVLRKQGIKKVMSEPLQGIRIKFPGICDYVWTTYLNSTLAVTLREGSSIVIAALTSPAAFGLYRIAQQLSKVLPMLSDPLYQSTYPELARLWSANQRRTFFSVIKRTTFFVGVSAVLGWLSFVLSGRWLIALALGPGFSGAYLVTLIYMLAFVIALCGICFQPAMLAMGMPRKSFLAISIGTISYFLLLFPLVAALGIVGASAAYVGYYIAWACVMMLCLRPYWVAGRTVVL